MAATLADVAKAAGVSLATASRVFGGPEKVSEATRQKVTKAAESLGYVANSTARALATGSSGLLGMVIPDLSSSYFAPLISAVQTEVEESGCELIIVDSRGKTDVEVEIAQRLHGRVDGLILASPRSSAQALSAVANRIPLVTVNRELPGISSVSIDVTAGLTKLCALLIKRGHRRIAYIGGPPGSMSDATRFATISSAMRSVGGTAFKLGPIDPNAQAGAHSFSDVREVKATAVIAYNALVAHGLILAATEAGRAVPHDLAVAAADDLTDIGLGLPNMTAITQPINTAGRLAGQMLFAHSRGRPQRNDEAVTESISGVQRIVLPTRLVLGDTA